MLPRGVDEYLERRRFRAIAPDVQGEGRGTVPDRAIAPDVQPASTPKAEPGSAEEREARKTLARLDKRLERIAVQEAELNVAIAEHAHDYTRLAELSAELAPWPPSGMRSSSSGWRPPRSCSSGGRPLVTRCPPHFHAVAAAG
jgi:hypothetical protein